MPKINISSKKYPDTYTLVDDDDFETLNQFKWSRNNTGYAVRTNKEGKFVLMHRVVLSAEKGQIIDHINGNPLDNRKSNLRFATSSQNAQNSRINSANTSSFKGVTYRKPRDTWVVALYLNNKAINLGDFKTKEEAAFAYNVMAEKTYKEFARLNEVSLTEEQKENVLFRLKFLGKGEKGKPKKLSVESIKEMQNLRKQGVLILDLCKKFGVCRSTVDYSLKLNF